MSKRAGKQYWVSAVLQSGDHVIQQVHTFGKKAHAIFAINKALGLNTPIAIESNVPNYKNVSNI